MEETTRILSRKGKEIHNENTRAIENFARFSNVISNPIFEVGYLVLMHNETKQSKLDSDWIGPGTVIQRSSDTNF